MLFIFHITIFHFRLPVAWRCQLILVDSCYRHVFHSYAPSAAIFGGRYAALFFFFSSLSLGCLPFSAVAFQVRQFLSFFACFFSLRFRLSLSFSSCHAAITPPILIRCRFAADFHAASSGFRSLLIYLRSSLSPPVIDGHALLFSFAIAVFRHTFFSFFFHISMLSFDIADYCCRFIVATFRLPFAFDIAIIDAFVFDVFHHAAFSDTPYAVFHAAHATLCHAATCCHCHYAMLMLPYC